MPQRYDVAVIGLGVIGAACAAMTARTGARVIAFDQFNPPHDQGSSHGETRIFRVSYAEGAAYAPLAQRAGVLWRRLEEETGETLFSNSGLIYAAEGSSSLITGVRQSAAVHGLRLDDARDDPDQVFFSPDASWDIIKEPDAGYLYAEKCVSALIQQARAHGAALKMNTTAAFKHHDGRFLIGANGEEIEAKRLIVSAGAWLPALAPEVAAFTRVERRSVHWFTVSSRKSAFTPFLVAIDDDHWLYALPGADGQSIKVANHFGGTPIEGPHQLDDQPAESELRKLEPIFRRLMPDIGSHLRSKNCLYTMTPDSDFLIGPHRENSDVFIAGGMSGHGFKFAPAIGEIAAQWVTGAEPLAVAGMFDPKRFTD